MNRLGSIFSNCYTEQNNNTEEEKKGEGELGMDVVKKFSKEKDIIPLEHEVKNPQIQYFDDMGSNRTTDYYDYSWIEGYTIRASITRKGNEM